MASEQGLKNLFMKGLGRLLFCIFLSRTLDTLHECGGLVRYTYHYDWYSHGSPMVHLRCVEDYDGLGNVGWSSSR